MKASIKAGQFQSATVLVGVTQTNGNSETFELIPQAYRFLTGNAITNLKQRLAHLIADDNLKARLIRAGLGSAGIRAANRVLVLALGILLARGLGAEGYGVYAYAFAIMTLLMVVAEAGVPTLLTREIAASHGREEWGLLRGAVRRAGQFVTLAASGVAIIGFLIHWGVGDRLSTAMFQTTALMLLLLPLNVGAKIIAHALMGLRYVVLGQALNRLLRPLFVLGLAGTAFVLWPETRQPQYAMIAQLLAASVVMVVGLVTLTRLLPVQTRTAFPVYRNRKWLHSALPFTLIGGAGVINNYADIIMLGWFSSTEDVGIYRVAVQGAMLVAFSLQVTNTVVAPQFSGLYARGETARLQHLVTQSARIIFFAAVPVALAFILAGEVLVTWVFGAGFAAAHMPLVILSAGQVIGAYFGPVGSLFSMTGYERIAARALWQTAVLNIAFNAILIPLYGMNGAAISTMFSLVIWNWILYRKARESLNISSSGFRNGIK